MLASSIAAPRSITMAVKPIIMQAPTTSVASTAEIVRSIGDYGFDPLKLGTDETFTAFREAEIKHGRLAMLAAVAWPLQEILHPILVDQLRTSIPGVRDVLAETNGFSPSLLNGGLLQFDVAPTLMLAVFMGSVLELKDLKVRQAKGLAWNEYENNVLPGDLNFDPLNIAKNLPRDDKIDFLEKELLNGRLAMIAITAYVAEEVAFGVPVIQFTPDLFQPLIFANDFRAFMDGAFGMASMDGSVNGVAF